MSVANSDLLLLFLKVTKILIQKLPLRTKRKRSSIEFERSENIGQFFFARVFNVFNVFNVFLRADKLDIKGFQAIYKDV